MNKALLNSTNTAFRFLSGEGSVLPILKNVFSYAIFPFPGLLLVGNNFGDALTGSIISSAAIQAFALGYVGWNYDSIKKELAVPRSKPVAILPSAVDAEKYLSSDGTWWNLVSPALMRLPMMLTGPLAIGNNFWQTVIAAGVGTALMEWSVITYVAKQMDTTNAN